MRLDSLSSLSTPLLLVLLLLLGRARVVARIVAGRPARIPGHVALPVPLVPMVLPMPAAIVTLLTISAFTPAIPSLASALAASAPAPAAAASASLPAPALAPASRFLGILLLRWERWGFGLPRGVPNSPLYDFPQLAPEPQLGKGLHDHRPTPAHAIVEALRLGDGRAVEEAKELRSVPFGGAIVGRSHWHARVELQEVVFVEPISQQPLHLAAMVYPAVREGLDPPALRRCGHLSLTDESAHCAEHPASLGEERLLRPLQHLFRGLSAHRTNQQLQCVPLLVEARPELICSLGEAVESLRCTGQVRVLVGV
mmetsp:Transcript_106354/g.266464  ORF Transcript_106354/g.266464 Transcript_106354/m.266464 type:complete len:312 (+) Transcript_106354:637-1572(+)